MTDATLRQAAHIQRMFMAGEVSHQTAQMRLSRTGYRLNDAALLAELRRQDDERQAAVQAAEARQRQRDQQINSYIRREHERTKGITIDGF